MAAVVLTMEQMQNTVPPELIQKCLSSIKSVIDFTSDVETIACIEQLRQIYTQNDLRIKAIDGVNNDINVTTTADQTDRKRVCRAATPSPTPEDEPCPNGVSGEKGKGEDACKQDDAIGGQRKRQRT